MEYSAYLRRALSGACRDIIHLRPLIPRPKPSLSYAKSPCLFGGVVFKISEVQLNQDSSDGFQELDPLPIEGGRGSEEGKCTICPQITLAYRYAIFLCSVENLVRKLKSIIQCLTTHCDTASLPEEVWLSS